MSRARMIVLAGSAAVLLASGVFSAYLVYTGRIAARNVAANRAASPTHPDSAAVAKVAVLNGCGRQGICAPFVKRLRAQGFDVVNGLGGYADSFDFPVSVVVDRGGGALKASKTARALGITRILIQRPSNPYLVEEIAVIIGRDWNTLNFPAEETKE
jgi:hypothetical protein